MSLPENPISLGARLQSKRKRNQRKQVAAAAPPSSISVKQKARRKNKEDQMSRRQVRKNTRERQRRTELNIEFEKLCGMLKVGEASNATVRKTHILSQAIREIEVLRKQLSQERRSGAGGRVPKRTNGSREKRTVPKLHVMEKEEEDESSSGQDLHLPLDAFRSRSNSSYSSIAPSDTTSEDNPMSLYQFSLDGSIAEEEDVSSSDDEEAGNVSISASPSFRQPRRIPMVPMRDERRSLTRTRMPEPVSVPGQATGDEAPLLVWTGTTFPLASEHHRRMSPLEAMLQDSTHRFSTSPDREERSMLKEGYSPMYDDMWRSGLAELGAEQEMMDTSMLDQDVASLLC